MINVICVAHQLAAPPTAPILGDVLLRYIIGSVLTICGQLPGAITVPECARFLSIIFAPPPCTLQVFIVVVPVPLLSIFRDASFIGNIPLSPRILAALAFAIFTLVLRGLSWTRLGIGFRLLKSPFSVRVIPPAISLQLLVAAFGIISSVLFSQFVRITRTPLAVIFAILLSVIFPIVVLFRSVFFWVGRISGFITFSKAGFAFIAKAIFGRAACVEVVRCCRKYVATNAALLIRGSSHSILTHANLTRAGQPGGVSAAFPVANGRLPMQTLYQMRAVLSNCQELSCLT